MDLLVITEDGFQEFFKDGKLKLTILPPVDDPIKHWLDFERDMNVLLEALDSSFVPPPSTKKPSLDDFIS